MVLQSLAGLPAFLVYFCTAIIAVLAYLLVYTRITPHNEFELIRNNNPAAAIALGLSLLGFSLPLVSAIAHSANVWDCMIWSVDRADRADRRLLHRQDPGAEPAAADRRRRACARDLARARLARLRRHQRRLHDLLTMADKHPSTEFGKRRQVSVPPSQPQPPAKRSHEVVLLVMGTIAVGSTAYALMPRECTPARRAGRVGSGRVFVAQFLVRLGTGDRRATAIIPAAHPARRQRPPPMRVQAGSNAAASAPSLTVSRHTSRSAAETQLVP